MHPNSCPLDCKIYVGNLGNNGGCQVRMELSNVEKRSQSCGPPPSWCHHPPDDYWRRSSQPRCRSPKITVLGEKSQALLTFL
ncbi:hypothetical protein FD755_021725 [Muntiacus reevesi]|uniref:RRM domain-containing protein n=1 Tax=Muntiacus reevesi TaxID=9886 RepID=A0A5N3W5Y1_MUNRE|nr:hypothetical protein FD755_021725 [Muntiacus reevesi]